jgi:hypothetical protein
MRPVREPIPARAIAARATVVLALAGVLAGLAVSTSHGAAAHDEATVGRTDGCMGDACVSAPPAQASPEQELAERYAPIVYLKDQTGPCDKDGEAYAPVAVELVLDNPQVTLRQSADDPGVAGATARDLHEKGGDYYLDLPGDPSKPGCTYDTDFKALSGDAPNVVYAHVVTEPGKRGVALQYWFYYYFNDWNNNHESDWEMIQLFFDVDSVEGALEVEPDHAGYSQHSGGEYAGWTSDKLQREGTHPLVYVAAGSHSNQYDQRTYLGRAEEGAGYGCDDATDPGTRIDVEARLVPNTVTGPDDPFAWITYEGRWGERRGGEFNGPTGPNMKSQWSKPISWDESKLRSANVQIPTRKTAGISPSDAFCAVVAFASERLLGVVHAAPWLIPAAGVALAGGVFVTVRSTDFGLAREPLRRRRRFGQILRTATGIYRANGALMIAIALAFIPAGFVASGLQSLLFRFSPVESLLDVVDAPRVAEVTFAIGLGASVFGLAYVIVVAAVIAAVREIEAGRAISPLRAYRVVIEHVGALLRARLRAVGIVLGLTLTVVGIPWAIWQSVRWLFIEQAVLLDGATAQEAPRRSAAAVRGDWWRTILIASVLLAIGLITSLLVVTPIMLFATQVPLDVVNALSSLIYIFVSPFVALALTLLYFDVSGEGSAMRRVD